MKNSITKQIVIMGDSEMAEKFVETLHGTFETVGEAEQFGLKKIREIRWRVANRVTRTKDNGTVEVTHDFLTDIITPRRGLQAA